MNLNNMGDLLRNAHKIRKQIDQVQKELKERVVEASSGSGQVTVLVNGQQEVLKLSIRPEALSSNDAAGFELLEDLILAAIRQGVEKSKELKQSEIAKVTGGMGEGLSGLFF